MELSMLKVVIINVLVIATLKSTMGYVLPVFSALYIWHNIKKQIEDFYGGSVKEYIKSTFKIKKKNGDN